MIRCHYSVEHDVCFIPIPKCGSTSILAGMFGLTGTVEQIHLAKPRRILWDAVRAPAFAVLRSPWTRLVSVWASKVGWPHRPDTQLLKTHGFAPGTPFPDFAERVLGEGVRSFDNHVRPQVDFLPPDPGQVTILRMESLSADARRAGMDWLAEIAENRHLNVSGRTVDCPDDLEARVWEAYDDDAAMWGCR